MLRDINEPKHLSFDCKRKHMYKNGAPPDEFRVLNRFLPVEFHGFISEIHFLGLLPFGYQPLVPGIMYFLNKVSVLESLH